MKKTTVHKVAKDGVVIGMAEIDEDGVVVRASLNNTGVRELYPDYNPENFLSIRLASEGYSAEPDFVMPEAKPKGTFDA